MHWESFMAAIKVLAWVVNEPRKRFPKERLKRMLEDSHHDDTQDVTLDFLALLLIFTYSRTENPLPKTYRGRECYDPEVHWNLGDILLDNVDGIRDLWVRFRAIKQDLRCERPEAQGSGDWVWITDLPDSIVSIIAAYTRYIKTLLYLRIAL